MNVLKLLWEYLALLFLLALSIAIVVPIYGILVRFRANFNPRALQLDTEGGAQAHTGPVIKSVYAMTKRVYSLEGWSGFYKGIMPTAISTVVFTLFLLVFFEGKRAHHGRYNAPRAGVVGAFGFASFSLLTLPISIITNRAITTPHKLPYFQPLHSLRILLTPTERRRPWILFFTPGLVASQLLQVVCITLVLRPLRNLLLPHEEGHFPKFKDASVPSLITYFLVVLLSTAVLTPLEVISLRLMIQRNHAPSDYSAVPQEELETEETTEYAGTGEDVIGLRSESDPYHGLLDCGKKIADEEGWGALYRAWWLTAIGNLGGSVS